MLTTLLVLTVKAVVLVTMVNQLEVELVTFVDAHFKSNLTSKNKLIFFSSLLFGCEVVYICNKTLYSDIPQTDNKLFQN